MAASHDAAPNHAAPNHVPPNRAAPDRAAPDRAAPDRVPPDRATPDRAAPDRAAPDRAVPNRAVPKRAVTATFRRLYGAGPLHLAVLVVTLGVGAYAVVTLLTGEQASWLRIGVWFLAGVVVNDLVLNPLAAVLDGVLRFALRWLPDRPAAPTTINHLRVPVLGAALTFLVFFPGIVRQGEPVVVGQSGLDQSPFLLRWVLLVVGMALVSALVFAVRARRATRRSAAGG